ncbi:alkanesulfonate monooxygenase SsuD/methylene tetrahydromethanopterin reductase-like flavin-dependent oxidoreductase (luciferase family) [Streptomyces puniciscabiei]|uniref:Alkanesulfonate monooxygenase SsuD/methylene tetrahydromethanopterin reductase-like flavin-dependent oxidoreductase (Luciferase family) n=1 Tax=Streptomyces puniciscabiei TaxID=164348 RepID=A0A542UH04_9ACTN|nr:LLM class flavin-dependent oxidoreductase [Streptomyces puniciscabiei]TQK98343.1 alkanesulfonate monooxygenase SsuD/methylene tetrahydromethanopterin reductase-like flavin-dependent oxidoreductase (luciferase family) [Streptomyces puniciscabiei]
MPSHDPSAPPLRIGVLLPTREMAVTGDYSIGPLLDFAREAEDLGFDSLWAGDSLTARPRLDPLVVLAAVSAVTRGIGLGTAALTAALRHPLIGANTAASLDHASGGRLTLGLGAGFPVPESAAEFAAVGVPFDSRVGRLDETVRLWRQAWRADGGPAAAEFTGRYWHIDGLDRLPGPATPGGPPLWLASSDTPRVLSRVARHYDGWLPFLPDPKAYRVARERITELAEQHGRAPYAVTPGLYATLNVQADRRRAEAALDTYVQGYYGRQLAVMNTVQAYGWGSPRECADWLAEYVAAGARHLVLRIGSLDPRPHLRQIAEEVLPVLRASRPAGPVHADQPHQ